MEDCQTSLDNISKSTAIGVLLLRMSMRPIWWNPTINALNMNMVGGTLSTVTTLNQKSSQPLDQTELKWEMDQRWALSVRNMIKQS